MGGELRLFDIKGHGYRSIGQRVVVSYEDQDSCGFFNQVDYIGRVVSIDPFDGLLVKFDVSNFLVNNAPGLGRFFLKHRADLQRNPYNILSIDRSTL